MGNRPFTTAVEAVRVTHLPANVRTAQRRLKQNGLRNVAAKKMLRMPRHRKARIGVALEHLTRDEAFWSRVVFLDERIFQSSRDSSIKVYRPRNNNERYVATNEQNIRFLVNM